VHRVRGLYRARKRRAWPKEVKAMLLEHADKVYDFSADAVEATYSDTCTEALRASNEFIENAQVVPHGQTIQ